MRPRTVRALTMAAILALVASTAAAAGARPQRVVSMNLCTDQLVLLLAARGRIASVSYLAFDPEVSYFANTAQELQANHGLYANHGLAEEILPLGPDLILAGTYTTRATVAVLRRFGHRVLRLEPADGFDAIRKNIRTVARALGETAKAERIIAAFDRRLSAVAPDRDATTPRAIVLQPRGMTTGPGSLADGILRAAGLLNLSADLGVTGMGFLPLERIIQAEPDAASRLGKAMRPHLETLLGVYLRFAAFRYLEVILLYTLRLKVVLS